MLSVSPQPAREPRIAARHWVALGAAAAALAAAPFVLPSYPLAVLTLGLAYGLFAFGLDLAWGRAGVISIGHAAFFGAGAYGVAIAGKFGIHPVLGAVLALALTAIVALVIGRIGLGPKALPSTMAVLTLALTLLAEQASRSWLGLTGGSNGIYVPSSGTVNNYFLTACAVFVIVVVVWFFVIRGRFGRRMAAVHSNQHRTEHLAVNPTKTKLLAFVLGAGVASLAGSIAAPVIGLVSPAAIGIVMSTQVLVWVAVGGRGTILGAFLGAILVTVGQLSLGDALGSWYLLALGIAFIVIVKFAPEGVVGLLRRIVRPSLSRQAAHGTVIAAPAPPSAAQAAAQAATQAPTDAPPAIELRGLVKRFGPVPTINSVDLSVTQGEIVCLIGPNGAGKTTLLNLIAGDLAPSAGTITVLGDEVTAWPAYKRAQLGLGRLFQIPSLYRDLTPAQNLAMARAEAFRQVTLPAELSRFTDQDDVLARDLSLADQRALELALAIAWGPRVVLLDEPAAGLSHDDARYLAGLLRRVNAEIACTLVVVEHDMDIVRELADRVIALAEGQVLAAGTMDEVAAHPEVRSAYLGAV